MSERSLSARLRSETRELHVHAERSGVMAALLRGQLPLEGYAATSFCSAFNMALVSAPWPEIEPQYGDYQWEATDKLIAWCQAQSLRICMGPLVLMDKHALPDWLFLDEASSALSEADERALYERLLAENPGLTLVSVGHRPSLRAYHRRHLLLEGQELRPRAVGEGR